MHVASSCNGLPLWHGAQLAVDATSPLTRDDLPLANIDFQPSISLSRAKRRKRRDTYPELLRARKWSGMLVVASQRGIAASFLDLPADSDPGAAFERPA